MSTSTTPHPGLLVRLGWSVGISLGILAGYLILALALSAVITEPISATVALGAITASAIIAVRRLRPGWLSYGPPPQALEDPRQFWTAVAGCTTLAFLAGQAMGLWLYADFGSTSFEDSSADRAAAGSMALVLALVAAPLSEEALFRGLMYPLLRKRLGVRASIVLTTAAFAVLHGNVVQIAAALPLAVLTAVVYEHSRRLGPIIGIHLGFNLAAVLVPPALLAPLAGPLPAILLGMAFGLSVGLLIRQQAAQGPAGETPGD